MAHIARLFQEKGFASNCIEQSSTSIGFDAFGMDININIREPARVAYVTSVPGDSGERRVIGKDMKGQKIYAPGPGVRFASEGIPCRYVAEVQVSRISSTMPIYVIIPDGEPEPVKYVVKNILMLLASMVNNPHLQQAISTDTSDGQLKELPDYLKRGLDDAFTMLDLPEHELKRLGK